MSSLQEALQSLGPTTWDEIPKSQPDLRAYLSSLAQQARTIIASVPEPPPPSSPPPPPQQHDNQHKKQHKHTHTHAYIVTPSPAHLSRTTPDPDSDPDTLSLQRQWGKPLKPGHARDNPHEIPLYKLQASDGKATWFARRSVHAGMPFERWRGKLGAELEETLRMNRARVEKGLPPDRVVRGLGAARKVEEIEVRDGDGEEDRVIGGVRVYDICAHFPKPTTARDFVQVNVSWEDGVEDDSVANEKGGRRCRSWLSISKPCAHPELPPQEGYIRGQYDSLEFIREVPPVEEDGSRKGVTASDPNLQHEGLAGSKEGKKEKEGRKRGKTDSASERHEKKNENTPDSDVQNDGKPYPVEWIMVTRSDPGGSIPRWVIEKGTPKSIWSDTVKFIDWASRDDDKAVQDSGSKPASLRSSPKSNDASDNEINDDDDDDDIPQEQRNGLIANFAYLLNAGLERYAPQAILDYVPYQRQRTPSLSSDSGDSDDFNDAASTVSTRSSSKRRARSSSKTRGETESQASQKEGSNTSDIGQTNIAPIDMMQMDKKAGKLNSNEKHLAKLAQRKRDVQAKLDTVRTEIEALRLDAGASAGFPNDEKDKEKSKKNKKEKEEQPQPDASTEPKVTDTNSDQQRPSEESGDKQRPKHTRTTSTTSTNTTHRSAAQIHKAASGLFNQESKLLKQLGKIEQDQLKETSKIEARQKKQHEREEKSRSRVEVDNMKKEVEGLRKEVERLRVERQQWMDLVASLQGENQRLMRHEGGGGGQDG